MSSTQNRDSRLRRRPKQKKLEQKIKKRKISIETISAYQLGTIECNFEGFSTMFFSKVEVLQSNFLFFFGNIFKELEFEQRKLNQIWLFPQYF